MHESHAVLDRGATFERMTQLLGQMRVANLRVPNPAPRNGKRLPVTTLGPQEMSD